MKKLGIKFQGKDELSKVLGNITSSLGVLGTVGGVAFGAVAAAGGVAAAGVGALGAAIGGMVADAAQVEGTRNTFENLVGAIGNTDDALVQLRAATRGAVADSDLMAATNKFLSMNLTDSVDEAAKMAEMATQLGAAMGKDATPAMEEFALMLANNSIQRLDTFGISSSDVRRRIDELMASTQGLTREQAFTTATLELGAVAMSRVGEQGSTLAMSTARWEAALTNAKIAIGDSLIPVLTPLIEKFASLASEYLPILVAWFQNHLVPALSNLVNWVSTKVVPILVSLSNSFNKNVVPAIKIAVKWFTENMLPVLSDIWDFISTHILPLLFELSRFLGTVVVVAIRFLVGYINTYMVPAFRIFFEWVGKVLEPLGGLGGLLDRITSKLATFTSRLANVRLPSWLTPGSPTPFEIGLSGINSQMDRLLSYNPDFYMPASIPKTTGRTTTAEKVYKSELKSLTYSVNRLTNTLPTAMKDAVARAR